MRAFLIDTEVGAVPAVVAGGGSRGILLATGAGTGQDHPGLAGLRARLAASGYTVMTFEYPYRARGSPFPDPMPQLQAAHRGAAAFLRAHVDGPLVLAGRSMGGRVATMLAAAGEECAAVVCYGYPLHPPGRPERLRVAHLAALKVPTLFVTPSRDRLARRDLVERYLSALPSAQVAWVEGADHSFRRAGTDPEVMLDLLGEVTLRWLAGVASSTP